MHEVPQRSHGDAVRLLRTAAADVRRLDLAGLGPLELDDVVAAGRLVERATASLLLRAARRAADLAAAGEGPGPEAILGGRGAVSASLARAEACRASAATALPSFASALADGAVGTGHLDAVARALHQAADAEREALVESERSLLEAAERLSVDSFGRHLSRMVQRVREQVGTADDIPESELRLWQGRGGVGRLAGSFATCPRGRLAAGAGARPGPAPAPARRHPLAYGPAPPGGRGPGLSSHSGQRARPRELSACSGHASGAGGGGLRPPYRLPHLRSLTTE